jgi:DNA-binding response OmpR family regulator
VVQAVNGAEGYEMATRLVPDLIISDVMMPVMDGIEFCRKIKEDVTTSHIPFVMLTAKSAIEDKITGLETGADEYIEKPFNIKYLELKINSLMQMRQRMQKQVLAAGKQVNTNVQNLSVYDKDFLKKINDCIFKNLSNTDYSVELLGQEIGLSRAQLNRKLKALVNQSPMELIYTIRLEEARRLLTTDGYNVSDVAYMTGFKSPSSFSTVFKNKFGYPPSNVQQQG